MAKKWKVEVTANPKFCGVDAGGVQFAHGVAEVESERLAKWFKKHEGYKVTEVKSPAPPKADKKAEDKKSEGKPSEGGDNGTAANPADGGKSND